MIDLASISHDQSWLVTLANCFTFLSCTKIFVKTVPVGRYMQLKGVYSRNNKICAFIVWERIIYYILWRISSNWGIGRPVQLVRKIAGESEGWSPRKILGEGWQNCPHLCCSFLNCRKTAKGFEIETLSQKLFENFLEIL